MRTRFLRRRCNGSPAKKAIKRYFIIFVCAVIGLQLCGLSFFRDEKPKSAASPVSRHLLSSVEWEKCDWEIDHTRNYSDPSSWYAPSKAYNFVAIYTLMILIVFVALAIICDDFFVPSLEAISEKLDLSEDVAGATFMAAGSSAPELFTSIAGVAVESDVGVGTIVGSAVFNLLGICALSAAFAGKVLILDWKPLTRDATFYGLSIAFFVLFAHDGKFELYESIIMLVNYFIYILIMKFNPKLMELMSRLEKNKKVDPAAPCETAENCDETEGAKDSSHSFDDGEDDMESIIVCPCLPPVVADIPVHHGSGCLSILRYILSWILFLVSFPFVIMFTWTIPTCATPETKKYYMFSFVMSIAWIAALSFGMVTLVGRAGCILGIDKFTMGLVVVAIGTSIPDALSSVLVARDGYGDMAVSNAIGSNVFDIDLGIGLPFVISSLIRNFKPVHLLAPADQAKYDAGHLPIIPHVKFGFILLAILFASLAIFVVVRFRLNKYLGCAFVGIYVCFVSYAYIQDIYCHGTC